MSLKVGCLPYAVGKQPSIALINLGKVDIKLMMMMMMMNLNTVPKTQWISSTSHPEQFMNMQIKINMTKCRTYRVIVSFHHDADDLKN